MCAMQSRASDGDLGPQVRPVSLAPRVTEHDASEWVPLGVELDAAAMRLATAGIANPRADAERLAAHALGVQPQDRTATPLASATAVRRLWALVDRRAARVPLEHLVGAASFGRLELLVGPGVYVPQPETEAVVQAVMAHLIDLRDGEDAVVVDLCTGSGTIAMSVADQAPFAVVHAVEADPAALGWAERNRDRLELPVRLHLGRAEEALRDLDGAVDVVVSNPPYVAEHELAGVDPEVRDHDPRLALVGGSDGLAMIRVVEQAAWRLLRPGGLVVVEHSDRQGRSAPEVFAPRWRDVADHRDQGDRDRYVTAVRPGARRISSVA